MGALEPPSPIPHASSPIPPQKKEKKETKEQQLTIKY